MLKYNPIATGDAVFSDVATGDATTLKDTPIAVPIGWRFAPTDEELVWSYLYKKVVLRSLPARIIKEIDASEFYNHHPRDLVDRNSWSIGCFDQEGYFFIHGDKYFYGIVEKKQAVGDGIGFWRFAGKEEAVFDCHGHIVACKIHSTFFTTNPSVRRTNWNMEQYRLINTDIGSEGEEWVAARIRRGKR